MSESFEPSPANNVDNPLVTSAKMNATAMEALLMCNEQIIKNGGQSFCTVFNKEDPAKRFIILKQRTENVMTNPVGGQTKKIKGVHVVITPYGVFSMEVGSDLEKANVYKNINELLSQDIVSSDKNHCSMDEKGIISMVLGDYTFKEHDSRFSLVRVEDDSLERAIRKNMESADARSRRLRGEIGLIIRQAQLMQNIAKDKIL